LLHLAVILTVFAVSQIGRAQSTDEVSIEAQAHAQGDFAAWPKIKQDIQFLGGKSTLVRGLETSQVRVLEDGVEQPEVKLEQIDRAASICLLLDISSSMKESGKALMEAARRLIATANPADQFEIISFDGPVYLEQGFTTDREKLDAVFARVEFKGASDVYDAVLASVVKMKGPTPESRKVIVILSDGEENYDHINLDLLLRRLRYPGTPLIYSLSPPSGRDAGARNLVALSNVTGGFSYRPKNLSLLNDVAAEISLDIHSRYSLEYTSTHSQRDGKLHKVEIKVTPGISASKVKPYFRQEYYAPSH
jgi:Ca-activated chloride channel homolog